MKQKVIKTGNSLAVVLPAWFAKKAGVGAGDVVIVKTDTKRARVTYEFPTPRQLQLEE